MSRSTVSTAELSSKNLGLVQEQYNQTIVNLVLSRYPKFRDASLLARSGVTSLNIHLVHVSNLLAESLNLSLISVKNFSNRIGKFPSVTPIGYRNVPVNILKAWKSMAVNSSNSIFGNQERPAFGLHEPSGYNLVYCDKLVKRSDVGISMFTRSVDISVWVSLVASIIIIAIVMKLSVNVADSTTSISFNRKSYIMPVISGLVSFGVASNSKEIQHSLLFNLWTCVCIIFSTYYVGCFTSEIISPNSDVQKVQAIVNLLHQNYTIIYRRPHTLSIMQRVARINKPKKSGVILEELLKSALVVNGKEFHAKITGNEKYATVINWRNALLFVVRAQDYLKENEIKRQKCFVGTQVEYPEDLYISFYPPGSSRLSNKFQRFLQSGIIQRWRKETDGLGMSRRVQDRNRIINQTKITVGKDNVVAPLSLDGRIGKVYILWIICLSTSVPFFIIELLRSKVYK